MSSRSLRILCRVDWPDETVDRLWDGAGPYVDADGDVWRGCTLSGLDAIEQAMNGEAYTLALALTGVDSEVADFAWLHYAQDDIIGGAVRIMIQPCSPTTDQPVGSAEIKFIGTIDNIVFQDKAGADGVVSNVTVECTNRFTLRRLSNGAVLSDADQRARAAILNPGADPDRFCERVPLMQDKTVVWPRWN